MLDTKFVVNNVDAVKQNCKIRGYDVDVDAIVALDSARRAVLHEVESLRQQSNALAKQWQGQKDVEAHRAKSNELKAQEAQQAEKLKQLEEQLEEKLSWLPNILDPRVPVGGEQNNVVVRSVGEPPRFDFEPRSHEELGILLDMIDIPRGVRAAKSRFYCLKNEAVRMRFALIRMFSEHAMKQGFELVCPPFLARKRTLFASGYLPFSQKDNFQIANEDLSLIGTSEQSLLGMHLDEVMTRLPVLYLGDSMCFRTEAGNYGRDTAGILRVHQFYKLEQIVYCRPEDSDKWHQQCLENEEWLMRELQVPYRVVLTASGDLGAPGRIKYDTEAWLPWQKTYREMTSNTNMGEYQARRGNIRFKIGSDKGTPHTISATGFCDRLILAIMENFQQKDGSIVVPEKLVPYLGTSVIKPKG